MVAVVFKLLLFSFDHIVLDAEVCNQPSLHVFPTRITIGLHKGLNLQGYVSLIRLIILEIKAATGGVL